MKKQKKHAFRKDIYLLGKNQDGKNCWLEAGSWDCDWYWGFGYVETYTNNTNPEISRDISSHTHFDILFLKGPGNCYDRFKELLVETPLSDKEIWKLLELMETFYYASNWSDVIYRGGSHITTNPLKDIIKSEEEYTRINKLVIPSIMEEVDKLLSPEKHENKKEDEE